MRFGVYTGYTLTSLKMQFPEQGFIRLYFLNDENDIDWVAIYKNDPRNKYEEFYKEGKISKEMYESQCYYDEMDSKSGYIEGLIYERWIYSTENPTGTYHTSIESLVAFLQEKALSISKMTEEEINQYNEDAYLYDERDSAVFPEDLPEVEEADKLDPKDFL